MLARICQCLLTLLLYSYIKITFYCILFLFFVFCEKEIMVLSCTWQLVLFEVMV